MYHMTETYGRSSDDFRYSFKVIPDFGALSQYEFSSVIVKIISWMATNIGEYDGKRWETRIRLHFHMNPMTPTFDCLDVYFRDKEDMAAFKLVWA